MPTDHEHREPGIGSLIWVCFYYALILVSLILSWAWKILLVVLQVLGYVALAVLLVLLVIWVVDWLQKRRYR